MINVTIPAQEQVRLYFEGKEIVPIRIFLNSAGCGGPSLAMALDEKKRRMSCLPLMTWNTLWIRICWKKQALLLLILKAWAFVLNPVWNRLPGAQDAAVEHAVANSWKKVWVFQNRPKSGSFIVMALFATDSVAGASVCVFMDCACIL